MTNYFEYQEETNVHVSQQLAKIGSYLDNSIPGLLETVSTLPKERMKQKGANKAFFFRKVYEFLSNSNWVGFESVAAAIELEMISQYYSNQVYDFKRDCTTSEKVRDATISSKITHGVAKQIVSNHEKLNESQKFKICSILDDVMIQVESGQFLDSISTIDSSDFNQLLEIANKRMFLLGGYYQGKIARIAAICADAEEKCIPFENFGYMYGTALQYSNDATDMVIDQSISETVGKSKFDTHKDMLNGRLTLPSVYAYFSSNEDLKNGFSRIYGKESTSYENLIQITTDMVKEGIIAKCRRQLEKDAKKCRLELRNAGIEDLLLEQSTIVLHANKRFKSLKKKI